MRRGTGPGPVSSEPAADVVLGPLIRGAVEDLLGAVEFNQQAGSTVGLSVDLGSEKAVMSLTRAACCMLWVTITIV